MRTWPSPSAYITRTLTAYKISTDGAKANTSSPTWRPTPASPRTAPRRGRSRSGTAIKWQDGSPVTCADVKYGVSRTFATDRHHRRPDATRSQYLDIPNDKDGNSIYKGPYDTKTANKAAGCLRQGRGLLADNKTITFHLNQPVGDFNYTVTLGVRRGAEGRGHR